MDLTAHPRARRADIGAFILYLAGVLTVVMLLFPPFVSLNGTEFAFVLTGPEWSRALGGLGDTLGLSARIHWVALCVEIGALWAIALGAVWCFGGERPAGRRSSISR